MPKEFSEDLRWRVVYLYTDGFSIIDIANTLYMSKSSVTRIINIYEKWACVTNPYKGISGRRKLFSRNDMYILQNLIRDKVNWYLDELVSEMENLTGKRASIATLWRSLHYLGITRKKVLKILIFRKKLVTAYSNYSFFFFIKLQKEAYERSEIMRAHYLGIIGEHYTPNQLIFIDESAKDERSLSRLYGYSPRNIRACKKVVFVRGKRYTILPALTLDGFVAVDVFEGACDKNKFVKFVLDQVVCKIIILF